MPATAMSRTREVAMMIATPDPDIERDPDASDPERLRVAAFDLCTRAIAVCIELDCAHEVESTKLVEARLQLSRARRAIRDLGVIQ